MCNLPYLGSFWLRVEGYNTREDNMDTVESFRAHLRDDMLPRELIAKSDSTYLHTYRHIVGFGWLWLSIARSAPLVPLLGRTSIISIEKLPMDIFQ